MSTIQERAPGSDIVTTIIYYRILVSPALKRKQLFSKSSISYFDDTPNKNLPLVADNRQCGLPRRPSAHGGCAAREAGREPTTVRASGPCRPRQPRQRTAETSRASEADRASTDREAGGLAVGESPFIIIIIISWSHQHNHPQNKTGRILILLQRVWDEKATLKSIL